MGMQILACATLAFLSSSSGHLIPYNGGFVPHVHHPQALIPGPFRPSFNNNHFSPRYSPGYGGINNYSPPQIHTNHYNYPSPYVTQQRTNLLRPLQGYNSNVEHHRTPAEHHHQSHVEHRGTPGEHYHHSHVEHHGTPAEHHHQSHVEHHGTPAEHYHHSHVEHHGTPAEHHHQSHVEHHGTPAEHYHHSHVEHHGTPAEHHHQSHVEHHHSHPVEHHDPNVVEHLVNHVEHHGPAVKHFHKTVVEHSVSLPGKLLPLPEPILPPIYPVDNQVVISQYHKQDGLGRYSFGYEGDTSSRHESKDEHGVVTGTFSYKDPHGDIQTQEYIADKGGFRTTGTNLPVGPARKKRSPGQFPASTGPLGSFDQFGQIAGQGHSHGHGEHKHGHGVHEHGGQGYSGHEVHGHSHGVHEHGHGHSHGVHEHGHGYSGNGVHGHGHGVHEHGVHGHKHGGHGYSGHGVYGHRRPWSFEYSVSHTAPRYVKPYRSYSQW